MARRSAFEPPFVEKSGGGGSDLTIQKDDTPLTVAATILNFVGHQITANVAGSQVDLYVGEISYDVLANRPAAANAPSALFFATDPENGYWSYSDGATWQIVEIDINNGTQGILELARGGTGADNASDARDNLGLGTAATSDSSDFDPSGAAATAESNANAHSDANDITTLASAETYADGKVIDSIANSDTTHAPSRNAVFDALALKADTTYVDSQDATNLATAETYADGKVIDSIADSDTTHAPSRNAVFDALALKANLANAVMDGDTAGGDLTGTYPSPTLASIITGATKGTAAKVPQITYDAKGRITAATEVNISGAGIDTSAIHSGDAAGGVLNGTYPNPGFAIERMKTLTPTSLKMTNYSAQPGDLVLIGADLTVTLPTAPADKTIISVQSCYLTTPQQSYVYAGGSDLIRFINQTLTNTGLILPGQSHVYLYDAASAMWNVITTGAFVTSLDTRYQQFANMIPYITNVFYPVGTLYMNYSNSTNPGTLIGYGTWVAVGVGKVLVGFSSGDPDFGTAGGTGGAKTVASNVAVATQPTFTVNSHTHPLSGAGQACILTNATDIFTRRVATGFTATRTATNVGDAASTTATGNSVALQGNTDATAGVGTTRTTNVALTNNATSVLQPYEVVYMWRRTV